ncbi:homoserine O-acetyltransferase [Thraustotheca clavata]|uniref:Homoserine O-acetyltransferase n=1 Tax=Thraustotheca clavata TaxID=74557 RepID=A0A1W0A6D2_9STRA|nr:homoserine O-acetyltransferase [Thraustotheca clavata]
MSHFYPVEMERLQVYFSIPLNEIHIKKLLSTFTFPRGSWYRIVSIEVLIDETSQAIVSANDVACIHLCNRFQKGLRLIIAGQVVIVRAQKYVVLPSSMYKVVKSTKANYINQGPFACMQRVARALGRVRHLHASRARWGAAMEDEYGVMEASKQVFNLPHYTLESGITLENVDVNYKTFGELNAAKDNVMVVCHALTGNAALDSWWSGLLGDGKPFDTSKYLVVCANILGSCYGTTGPTSINPKTNKRYGADFPLTTVRDTIAAVVGGSLGGMQTLEWGFLGQGIVQRLAVIACGARHTAWQIGISEVQRQAIYRDPRYANGHYDPANPPRDGLAIARQMAMLTYRTHAVYDERYGRNTQDDGRFSVQSYLDYQGDKFLTRFDANSYVAVTKSMDTHDVGRNRGGIETALRQLGSIPVSVVGIDSDLLYPPSEQQQLHELIPNSKFLLINSPHGHDGFLLEQDAVGHAVNTLLA